MIEHDNTSLRKRLRGGEARGRFLPKGDLVLCGRLSAGVRGHGIIRSDGSGEPSTWGFDPTVCPQISNLETRISNHFRLNDPRRCNRISRSPVTPYGFRRPITLSMDPEKPVGG